jgi:hypothetical protein
MKRMSLIILFMFHSYGFAAGWATNNGTAKITSVSIETGFVKVLYSATDSSNPDTCDNDGLFILKDDTKNGDRQYAAILAAQASQRPVRIYVVGCFNVWNQTWPKLHAFFIE